MTAGSVEPVLVLALGNQLLSDDGVGMVLLDELHRDRSLGDRVEFVDGGTQGLALLGRFTGRQAVVLLDAVALGRPPGTIHREIALQSCPLNSKTSHDANAVELLRFAALLDELPEKVIVIGIEPEKLTTGIGLSESVAASIPEAVRQAREAIQEILVCA